MEFRVESLAPCRKKVTVIVPPERVREEVEAQFREINKQLVLPGFRPGKAPRKILEARLGAHVKDEVRSKLAEAAVQAAVEEKKIVPLGRPEVDVHEVPVEEGKPFEFAFEVTTRPEFELPAHKGLEVRVPAVHVTDQDVNEAVDRMRLAEGSLEASTAPLAAGDVAVLDWKATQGGQALYEGQGVYYRLGRGVVDGVVVEGLDAALEGKTAGAAASGLKGRAAPGDLRPALAGQEFEVAVELKDAKRFVPAPLDAAFLKRHDFDDEAELRKDVRRRVLRMRERERDRLAEDRLVDLLVSKTEMALPADLVDGAVEGWARRRQTEGEAEGRDADEVAKETAASRDEVKARVEADLRRQFVLDRVCEAESVEVGEPELVGAVEQMARESGRSTSEVMAHFQEDPGRLAELRSHLRHSKAREALRRAAVVVEEAPPAAHA